MRKLARAGIALVLSARAALSQAPHAPCLDSLPADSLTTVRVWLVLTLPDSSRVLRPHAESFTWALADQLHGMLRLPEGEPKDAGLDWRDLYGQVRVFVRPNGTFTWRFEEFAEAPATRPRAYRLADSALAALAAARPIFFPIGAVRRDSMSFVVDYQWPLVRRNRTLAPLRAFFAVPMFTVRRPWEEPATVIRQERVHYPNSAAHDAVRASFSLRAIIDTTGRVDSSSVRGNWPPDVPMPREGEAYYRDFVAAARTGLLRSRFAPALIGGCKVRMPIEQPFEFLIGR